MKQVAINRVFIELRSEDMSKVICPCVECIHNGKHYVCKADKVEFKYRNMATVNEGRVDMWICKQYELSEYAKKIEAELKDLGDYPDTIQNQFDNMTGSMNI